MNLLFVIDDAYVEQFKVVLYSIVQQMPNQTFQVYLMQKVLLKKDAEIRHFVEMNIYQQQMIKSAIWMLISSV